MNKLTVDLKRAVSNEEIDNLWYAAEAAHSKLENGTGAGNDFLGWVNLPETFDKEEYTRIKAAAKKIQSDSEILVVVGIGGSYLGARAVIEALTNTFHNILDDGKRNAPRILYAGNSISSVYLADLLDYLKDKDFSVNVISKSGTTTEPAIAFRFLKQLLEKKYSKEEAKGRIYVTTDKSKGALKGLADSEGMETFVVPDDVGGRFSVLTAVGLLPIAVAGIDTDNLLDGALSAHNDFKICSRDNACYRYAVARNVLLNKGKSIELLVNYEPKVHYFSEWFKQLFGESEGKDNKGLFPASVDFSTDLHSMGQYIQEGRRIMFETVLNIEQSEKDVEVFEDPANVDGLNFLSGVKVSDVNKKAFLGTLAAHTDGQVPNIVVNVPKLDAFNLGYLIYFFEKACGISGYILGVNPFNQPGVESYKKNMFALLDKPGSSPEFKLSLQEKLSDLL